MNTQYFFYQAGSIPGIPGTFGHCRVDIAEDGTQTITPLPLVPHEPVVLGNDETGSTIVAPDAPSEKHEQSAPSKD